MWQKKTRITPRFSATVMMPFTQQTGLEAESGGTLGLGHGKYGTSFSPGSGEVTWEVEGAVSGWAIVSITLWVPWAAVSCWRTAGPRERGPSLCVPFCQPSRPGNIPGLPHSRLSPYRELLLWESRAAPPAPCHRPQRVRCRGLSVGPLPSTQTAVCSLPPARVHL